MRPSHPPGQRGPGRQGPQGPPAPKPLGPCGRTERPQPPPNPARCIAGGAARRPAAVRLGPPLRPPPARPPPGQRGPGRVRPERGPGPQGPSTERPHCHTPYYRRSGRGRGGRPSACTRTAGPGMKAPRPTRPGTGRRRSPDGRLDARRPAIRQADHDGQTQSLKTPHTAGGHARWVDRTAIQMGDKCGDK